MAKKVIFIVISMILLIGIFLYVKSDNKELRPKGDQELETESILPRDSERKEDPSPSLEAQSEEKEAHLKEGRQERRQEKEESSSKRLSFAERAAYAEKLSMKEVDLINKRIDKIEQEWEELIFVVFRSELNFTEEEFDEYMKMREDFEQDRAEAYEKFYAQLSEGGEGVPLTEENQVNDEKILEEYQELFKDRFGEEAYGKYLQRLDGFNSDLRKREDSKYKTILTIDY